MQSKSHYKLKYFGPGLPLEKIRHGLLYKYAYDAIFPKQDASIQGFNLIGENFKFSVETEFKTEQMKDKYEPAFTSMFKKSSHMGKLFYGLYKASSECRPYVLEIMKSGHIKNNFSLLDSYPNKKIYQDIEELLKLKYPDVRLGFTELPLESVFLSRPVLFGYALVFIQEMQHDKIAKAPFKEAGDEVMRIYADLGAITNEVAKLLRTKYHVKCQTIHPAGGDVNLPQLAVKAGLGGFSKSGNVINKEFGSRHRISALLLQNKVFNETDNQEHQWIESFCSTCNKCVRECPTGAIYQESKALGISIAGIGEHKQATNLEKCHSLHMKTIGCSICLKVCPFSNGNYNKIKDGILRN